MPSTRARSVALLIAGTLLAAVNVAPATAADSPEAAVEALFDAVAAGDLDDLDAIVCAEAQAEVRTAFEPAETGLADLDALFDAMSVDIVERSIEITQQDEDSARATVQATLTMNVDSSEIEPFVRSLIEASVGPDDPPLTDEDLALMMPYMVDALAADQVIDSEIRLVLEGGDWLVCDAFGESIEDAEDEGQPIVTTEGLCALATPEEISSLSSLEYDSSTGFNEYCTYSQSDPDEFHMATVSVAFASTLDEWREAFAPDGELEVAGSPALSTAESVLVQAGEDVLQVTISLPEPTPEGVDALTQATGIAELLVPRLSDLVLIELPDEGPSLAELSGLSLCDGMELDELDEISGRTFSAAGGNVAQCTWESQGGEAGYVTIVATVSDLGLDDYREWMAEPDEIRIDDQPAIAADNQVVAELPDGGTLDVTVWYDAEAAEPELPADLLAAVVAESLLPVIPALASDPSDGLLQADGSIEDACAVVPAADLSAMSGIAFDDPGFGGDYCEYYGGDEASGWHYATSALDERPLEAWFEDFPQASPAVVGGQEAALVSGIFPDMGESAAVFVTLPGYDELTFGIGLGIDTSTGFEADAAAIVTKAAELALERFTGGD